MSTVSLSLDKPFFFAGELITGKVLIDARAVLQASSLTIHWIGFERARLNVWYDPARAGESKIKEEHLFGKKFTLTKFRDGKVQPGHYEFPVQFQTIDTLPGVFSHFNDRFGTAVIKYKAKVRLEGQGNEIKGKRDIIIVPASAATPQLKSLSCTKDKKFRFTRGKLEMTVKLGKNVFSTVGSIPVKVQINNETGKDVNAIKIKLNHCIVIRCCKEAELLEIKVAKKKFPVVVKAGTKFSDELNFELDSSHVLIPSTTGTLVTSYYYFDVGCVVKMARNLEIRLPFQLVLMPENDQSTNLYTNLEKGCWKK